MFIRKYYGDRMKAALNQAKAELGDDIVLLSQRQIADGRVELTVGKESPEERQPPERSSLDEEIREIKKMLHRLSEERELAGLGTAALFLCRELRDKGMSEQGAIQVVRELAQGIPADDLLNREVVRRELKKYLFSRIQTLEPRQAPKGCVVLLGRTGVGKTTTLAKLASRERFVHGRRVAILSLDDGKLGARDELERLGRLLGVPTGVAYEPGDIPDLLTRFQGEDTVFVDTPGAGLQKGELPERLRQLAALRPGAEFHLLLSPHYRREILLQDLQDYGRFALASVILTKLDESRGIGEMLDVILTHPVPLSWMTTGQDIPNDILPTHKGLLFDMMMEA